jgi:hypothetical protein
VRWEGGLGLKIGSEGLIYYILKRRDEYVKRIEQGTRADVI